jgi:hypothetical protein
MFDPEAHAPRINRFFNTGIPVRGYPFTSLIEPLLDGFSVPLMLAAIVALIAVVGALNSLPFIWFGYTTVRLFVLL